MTKPVATDVFDDDLNVSIVGLGVQYPEFQNGAEALETLAKRHYPPSTVMSKVLAINRYTGIDTRSCFGNIEHPVVNQPSPPTIADVHGLFMECGVPISVSACHKAIQEWGGSVEGITHMVSTTCTDSANPGFDHFVAKQLGLSPRTEKTLLHGVGCSGGLAAIRTAANLALGARARRIPARVLVLACEVTSVLVRSELDSVHQNQEVRIGACLFSDGASACIISNGIGEVEGEMCNEQSLLERSGVFDILGWYHELIPDTAQDLAFDVDPLGWKVILTPRVPSLTCSATEPAFRSLVSSIPAVLRHDGVLPQPKEFIWALHPGGSSILTGIESALDLSAEEHLRASYEVYIEHGNSSSATIMSVMNQLRRNCQKEDEADDGASVSAADSHLKPLDGKGVVALAFGPGITLEMVMLRRRGGRRSVSHPNGTAGPHHTNGVNISDDVSGSNGMNCSNGANDTGCVNSRNGVKGSNGVNGTNGFH